MAKRQKRSGEPAARRIRPDPRQMSLFEMRAFDMSAPPAPSPAAVGAKKAVRRRTPSKLVIERPVVLTTEEAALYINMKPATLKKWRTAKAGRGPRWVGRGTRYVGYTIADLEAWLVRNRQKP